MIPDWRENAISCTAWEVSSSFMVLCLMQFLSEDQVMFFFLLLFLSEQVIQSALQSRLLCVARIQT